MKKIFMLGLLLVLALPGLGRADFVEVEGQTFEFAAPEGFIIQSELPGAEIAALLDEIGAPDREDFLIYARPEAGVNWPELLLIGKSGRYVVTDMNEDDFALFTLFVSVGLMAEDESNPFGAPAVMDKAESLLDVVVTLSEARSFSFSVIIDEEAARYGAMVSYYHIGDCLFNVIQVGLVDELPGYNDFIGRAAANLEALAFSPVAAD